MQAVRYSPKGDLFASAGFDGKVFLYDGSSSDLVGEVGSPAHGGGVYGVAWSPDGKQLLTASGDKTAKLWDVETRQVVSEFVLGNTVEDQQVIKFIANKLFYEKFPELWSISRLT